MTEPIWIDRTALHILHNESLATHGGLEGLRDEGMLEPALMRPVNLYLYEQCEDLCRLAAAYGFGLARNHLFLDGNKRAAFIATVLFLRLNGQRLSADQIDAYNSVIHLADGSWAEDEFAAWLHKNIRPV